jgi:hypothetical protein
MVNQILWVDWCRELAANRATPKEKKMNYCTHDDGRTLVTRDGLGKCPLCVSIEDVTNLRARSRELLSALTAEFSRAEKLKAENEQFRNCRLSVVEACIAFPNVGEYIAQLEARLREYEGWTPDQFLRAQKQHREICTKLEARLKALENQRMDEYNSYLMETSGPGTDN